MPVEQAALRVATGGSISPHAMGGNPAALLAQVCTQILKCSRYQFFSVGNLHVTRSGHDSHDQHGLVLAVACATQYPAAEMSMLTFARPLLCRRRCRMWPRG